MRNQPPIDRDLVLLGAGHAHVEVLRRFAMRPAPGLRITLIGREPHTPYSGMLPGLIRGEYGFDAAHIDLAPLAAMAGARLIVAEAAAIDPEAREVRFAARPAVGFDVLSIDVGGIPAMPDGAGTPVKPIGGFLARLDALAPRLAEGARVAVVGGGAGGVELALALARRFPARIALVCAEAEPLTAAPRRARAVARAALAEAGVELACGVRALGFADGRLSLSDGSALAADAALWATGVVGPPMLAASGLACDAAGCVAVDRTLASVSHPHVFAAGDCAAIQGAARPKSGVWAVRAGAPLAANLRRALTGRRPRPWRPQKQALAILGLGGGRAVAWRNGLSVSGRLVWRWKDWIDRRWMAMYADAPRRMMARRTSDDAMRCAGCAAKLPAEALRGVLAALPRMPSKDILIGLDAADDAAAALPPPGQAVVQTVDQFRAFIDDPYVFGQIAAAHALSDLHAMGARPWTALAVAAVPYMTGGRMAADLAAMMQGAAEVLTADGCALVGGHSAEGAEAMLGFAVTGLAEPVALWRKAGLAPGDALVLTKPVGTGVILAAQMRARCKARWLEGALASMRRSNGPAAAILRAHKVRACTDVTGFGLAGHLTEMLRASGVAAVLDPDAVPALEGARELAAEGIESTLAPANRAALPGASAEPSVALLFDPQTSGGLLAGVPGARAAGCVAALRAAGIEAAVVGRVLAAASGRATIALEALDGAEPEREGRAP
ncbi:MAG: selenide, water dikinase SelD [Proteobacteria bacterium]|nr:selenide, water dikinase SelD [Pseudomonadota bacterium]